MRIDALDTMLTILYLEFCICISKVWTKTIHAKLYPVNPRRAGGVWTPPIRFFADSAKTASRSAAVFGTPFHTSFSHIV